MPTTTAPPSLPPDWAYCAEGADPAADPVGCRGAQVTGFGRCLAHLDDTERAAYLATLAPGSPIDHRATMFTEALLAELLDALRDPTTQRISLGRAVRRGDRRTRAGRPAC